MSSLKNLEVLPGFKWNFALLSEVELSGDRTAHCYRILTQVEIILPFDVVGKLDPRTDRVEVIYDDGNSLAVANHVVVLRNKVETNVILLTIIQKRKQNYTKLPLLVNDYCYNRYIIN